MERNALSELMHSPLKFRDSARPGLLITLVGCALWLAALFLPVNSTHYGNWNSTISGWQLFLLLWKPGYLHLAAAVLACNAIVVLAPFYIAGVLRNTLLVKSVSLLSTLLTLVITPIAGVFLAIGSGHYEAGCYCWVGAILLVSWGCWRMMKIPKEP